MPYAPDGFAAWVFQWLSLFHRFTRQPNCELGLQPKSGSIARAIFCASPTGVGSPAPGGPDGFGFGRGEPFASRRGRLTSLRAARAARFLSSLRRLAAASLRWASESGAGACACTCCFGALGLEPESPDIAQALAPPPTTTTAAATAPILISFCF